MKVDEFLAAVIANGDDVDHVALIEAPAELQKKWQRTGKLRKKALLGIPCFKGIELLYQNLDSTVRYLSK